jgi:fibronectin-binding autotransporter adhesin
LQTTGTGAQIKVIGGSVSTLDGSASNSVSNTSSILVGDGQTLALKGEINNTGTISISSTGSNTGLQIVGAVTLAGLGKITLSDNTHNAILSNGSDATLSSDNTISGAGTIGDAHLSLNLLGNGVIDASTANGIDLKANVNNAGLIEALGTGANLKIDGATITAGVQIAELLASGTGAHIDIGGTIAGGILKTVGTGAQFNVVTGSQAELDGSGANNPITSTASIMADNGSNLILKGAVSNAGTITLGAAGAGNHLEVLGAVTLSGAGTVKISENANNGIIADGSGTLTNVDNTISGPGTIGDGNVTLDNQTKGLINGNSEATALTINTGNHVILNEGTIEGTTSKGVTIASDVTNSGTLQALGTNAFLTIEGTVFNVSSMQGPIGSIATGTIQASSGGSSLAGVGTGGARVVLGAGATIVGGILKSSGSASSPGFIEVSSNAVIDGSAAGMPVFISGTLEVIDAAALTLKGTINNSGSLLLQSIGDATQLKIMSEVDLSSATAAGKITLTDNAANSIVSDGNSASLINTGNTISGAGTIGDSKLTINNQSGAVINGNGATNVLILSTGANAISNEGTLAGATAAGLDIKSNVTNSSLLEALGTGARLHIDGATITNTTNGVLLASGTNAHVDLDGATVVGGTLTTKGTGAQIDVIGSNASTFDGSVGGNPLTDTGTTIVGDGSSLILKGAITIGSIALNSIGNATSLEVSDAVTISGAGKITLSDNVHNAIVSADAGASLANVASTISGAGTIGDANLTLDNQAKGVIDASTANGIDLKSNVTNANLLEALGTGARLHIDGATITNTTTGNLLASGTNAHVDLDGATVVGGTLTTKGTGAQIEVIGTNVSTLDGTVAGNPVNDTGSTTISDGASLLLKGAVNIGGIALHSTGDTTGLDISGSIVLSGTGAITLTDNSSNAILSDGSAATLTNVTRTISGAGTIGDSHLTLANQSKGVINGNGSVNSLIIAAGGGTTNAGIIEGTTAPGVVLQSEISSNNGTIEALIVGKAASAHVEIQADVINTTNGVILASGKGAEVDLDNVTITGGTLKTATGGLIDVVHDSAIMGNATNAGALTVSDAVNLDLGGTTFTNTKTGIVSLLGSSQLVIDDAMILQGGGTIHLAGTSAIIADGSATTLTNGTLTVAHTISGVGNIGDHDGFLALNNAIMGIINANDGSGGILHIDAFSFSNSGLLEATSHGVLEIDSTITDTTTGQVKAAAAGAHINLNGADIDGGTISTVAGSFMDGVGGSSTIDTTKAIMNAGRLGAENGNLTITGAVTNTGTLDANNGHMLDIQGIVTGKGTAAVENAGILEFGAASSAKVTFGTGGGTLALDTATDAAFKFTSTISGFAHSDDIDLGAFNFNATSISGYTHNATGGVLTVTDGTHTESLAFVGANFTTFTAASFSVQDEHVVHNTIATHHADILLV